jgi:hypothetical protein
MKYLQQILMTLGPLRAQQPGIPATDTKNLFRVAVTLLLLLRRNKIFPITRL